MYDGIWMQWWTSLGMVMGYEHERILILYHDSRLHLQIPTVHVGTWEKKNHEELLASQLLELNLLCFTCLISVFNIVILLWEWKKLFHRHDSKIIYILLLTPNICTNNKVLSTNKSYHFWLLYLITICVPPPNC